MIYAKAGLNILGMLSILIEKTERSLRLVGVVAPTPRREITQIFNLKSSIPACPGWVIDCDIRFCPIYIHLIYMLNIK